MRFVGEGNNCGEENGEGRLCKVTTVGRRGF